MSSATPRPATARPSYAQAIGVVNALCHPRDRVVTAAGGLPAEVTANWRTLGIGTVDVDIRLFLHGLRDAGGWGARIAQSEREPSARPSFWSAMAAIS